MIVFGSRGTHVANNIISQECPKCGTENSTRMFIFQQYAHIFWIPAFPVGKKVVTECDNCKQVIRKNGFPKNFLPEYEALKASAKTPWWTFIGLVLLAIYIMWAVYAGKQDDKQNVQLISNPQKEDIYEVKLRDDEYTLYKVDRVEGDVVYVYANEYVVDNPSGIYKLEEKPYSKESYPILKLNLQYMLEKGEILDVNRK